MNKEIKFYFTESDPSKGEFLSFIRINDDNNELGRVQIWAGPVEDEQSQTCVELEPAQALEILQAALKLLKE